MHTSYSALNTFLTCPLKYKYQQIDRIKTVQTAEQAFGSLIHRTLRFAHSPSSKGYPDKETVINFFSQNWNQEVFKKEEEERGFFEDGIRILNSYLDSLTDNTKKSSIALEYRFTVKIGNHTLGGAIDRIDRTESGFEIIDYKTSRKIPPQKEIDDDLQLSIYLRAFITEWPSLFEKIGSTANIRLSLDYLRHGLRLSTTRTPEDLRKIDAQILEIVDQVEKTGQLGNFEPRLNALCDWCDFQKICPLWSHKFKTKAESQQSKEKEIREASKKFILLKLKKREIEKEIAELGKAISEYLEQEKLGRFFVPEGNILKALRETYKYDAKDTANIIKQWNKDPFLVMKVDNVALKRLASGLSAEQRRELAKLKKLDKQSYVLVVKNR